MRKTGWSQLQWRVSEISRNWKSRSVSTTPERNRLWKTTRIGDCSPSYDTVAKTHHRRISSAVRMPSIGGHYTATGRWSKQTKTGTKTYASDFRLTMTARSKLSDLHGNLIFRRCLLAVRGDTGAMVPAVIQENRDNGSGTRSFR